MTLESSGVPGRLAAALAERARETLEGQFEVTVNRQEGWFALSGVGSCVGHSAMVYLPSSLNLRLPALVRLNLACESFCEVLEEALTNTKQEPWPSADAKRHIQVDRETIRIWWEGGTEDDATIRLAPISRAELGM